MLHGARQTLRKVKVVIFECSDLLWKHAQQTLQQTVAFLEEMGFESFKLGSTRHLRLTPPFWRDIFDDLKYMQWSDCLALPKKSPLLQGIPLWCPNKVTITTSGTGRG